MHGCLELTKLMSRKLPVELRETIYQYLCNEDQPIPVGPYYHFRTYRFSPLTRTTRNLEYLRMDLPRSVDTGLLAEMRKADVPNAEQNFITLPDGRIKYDHSVKRPSNIRMPYDYIFDPRYVGVEIASEAKRFYYSNNTFSLCSLEDGIERFLELGKCTRLTDDGKIPENQTTKLTMVKPIYFVHDLQVRIKYEHYNTFLGYALEHPTDEEEYAFERNFLRAMSASLDVLFRLPLSSRTLNLEFVVMTAFDTKGGDERRRFVNLLQALRNTIYRLMHDRENTSIKVIHHDPAVSPFPRNLTRLWSLTREQWELVRTYSGELKFTGEHIIASSVY